jgi:hypothetical protein
MLLAWRISDMVSKNLLNLHKKLHKEAIAIAGDPTKGIIRSASNSTAPWPIRPRMEIYPGHGVVDIVDTALAIAVYAASVAGSATLPPLPSE